MYLSLVSIIQGYVILTSSYILLWLQLIIIINLVISDNIKSLLFISSIKRNKVLYYYRCILFCISISSIFEDLSFILTCIVRLNLIIDLI